MRTNANKYQIETRNLNEPLHREWTTDGIGDQNEFESAAEARVAVRELRANGDSWAENDYRIVGPQGIESANMDKEAWQYAIDWQLIRLGLSNRSNGRSSMVANFDNDGMVELSDAEGWGNAMAPADLCAILEAIDADQSAEEIREELAGDDRGVPRRDMRGAAMSASFAWRWRHVLARGMREELLIWLDVPGVALKGETTPRVTLRIDAGNDGARTLAPTGTLEWTADRRLNDRQRTQAETLVRSLERTLRAQHPVQDDAKPPSRDKWDRQRARLADYTLRQSMGEAAPNDGARRARQRT